MVRGVANTQYRLVAWMHEYILGACVFMCKMRAMSPGLLQGVVTPGAACLDQDRATLKTLGEERSVRLLRVISPQVMPRR